MAAGAASGAAFINYSTSFDSADGFSDATSINGIDGWQSRANSEWLTSNTDTTGQLNIDTNGPSFTQAGSGGTGFDVGDMISISADDFYTDLTANSDLRFGLSNDTGANISLDVGISFFRSSQAAFRFNSYPTGSTAVTSEVASKLNTLYTFNTTITKLSTEGEFNVAWSWSGDSQTGSFTQTSVELWLL